MGEVFYDPGETQQGIYLLGPTPDGLSPTDRGHFLRVDPTPVSDGTHDGYTVVVTPAAQGANLSATKTSALSHVGTDTWFEGMTFNDVNGVYQLKLAATALSDGVNTQYHVQMSSNAGASWQEYCGDSTVLAVPITGWYDRVRSHHLDTTLTFACVDGIAGKCPLWGYRSGGAGPTPGGADTAWNRNQACTLMGNAEYCPDGKSHTREGTPIQYGNWNGAPYALPVYPWPPPLPGDPDAYSREAGWAPWGPVCLSKLRWRSLPLDPCPPVPGRPGGLPDPRTHEGQRAGGVFCDDLHDFELRTLGAVLLQGSKVMDAPLYGWNLPDLTGTKTIDTVMSMQGYEEASDTLPVASFVAPAFGPYVPTRAGMDSMILRNLPSSLPEAMMTKLFLWQRGADRVVASTSPPGVWNSTFEGYAFPSNRGAMLALRMCTTSAGNYITSVTACPGGAIQGWVLPKP